MRTAAATTTTHMEENRRRVLFFFSFPVPFVLSLFFCLSLHHVPNVIKSNESPANQ